MSLAKRAMELKSATEASAGGAATEHTESEFHVDDALAETLRSLQAIDTSVLQSTAEPCTSASSSGLPSTADELPQSTGEHGVPASSSQPVSAHQYRNVFGSPDPALSDALLWARTNASQPQVASWLEACSQWDSAIAAGEHRKQKKRRKLCKDHHILRQSEGGGTV